MFKVGLVLIFSIATVSCVQFGQKETSSALSIEAIKSRAPSSEGIELGDIVKDNYGRIDYRHQYEAVTLCESKKQRLPTARELAEFATSMGAAGISETAQEGYEKVLANKDDGKVDEFYFNNDGYKTPEGDLGNNYFWSSSIDSKYRAYAFALNGMDGSIKRIGIDGFIKNSYRNGEVAARCVKRHKRHK